MAKLLKLRRGTTSQHNTFTGAEGEVTIDTTKDTAVVHDGSTAGGTPLAKEDMSNVSSSSIAGRLGADSIATTKIAAGALPTDVTIQRANITSSSIMNSEVHASAAIAGTKISPNFGSQNITTTGNLSLGSGNATHNISTFNVGNTAINSVLSGSSFGTLQTTSPNGHHVIELQDNDANDSFAIVSGGGNFQTDSAIDTCVARFKANGDSSIHGNLDVGAGVDVTGNISVTGTVDGRDVAADGSKLDGIESGATGDQTSTEIKSLLASDNLTASHLAANSVGTSEIANGAVTTSKLGSNAVDLNKIQTVITDTFLGRTTNGTGNVEVLSAASARGILNVENGATADQTASEILTAIKTVDGAGSGLDADTVDGISSASFLRSDTADNSSGDITFSGGAGAVTISSGSDIRGSHGNWTGEANKIQWHSNHMYLSTDTNWYFRGTNAATRMSLDSSGNLTATGNVTAYSDARLKTDISTINDALGICGKLRGVSYKWLKDGSAGIGVIAQEVEEVIPEVVLTNIETDPATGEETEVKSVDYGKIVGVLINAINELKAEVEELKNAKITG